MNIFYPLYGIAFAIIALSVWELWQDAEDYPEIL